MSDERERAEQLVNDIHSRVDRDGELDDYWHRLCVGDVLAFAREERARVWEEAADRVGPHDDLYFEWRLKATALRKEGGR